MIEPRFMLCIENKFLKICLILTLSYRVLLTFLLSLTVQCLQIKLTICQEVMLKVIEQTNGWRGDAPCEAYLVTV